MTSKTKKGWKIAFCIIGIGLGILLAILYFSPRHKGDPFVHAVANGQFYVDGSLGLLVDPSETDFSDFTEYETGTEHGIISRSGSYYAVGSQYYYGEDENNQRSLIPEEHDPAGIFSRESVFSNRDFSQLRFCCEGSDEIMDIDTMEKIFCHYEEYRFKDTDDLIRLYFRGEQLYVVRAREDARCFFYVSTFSDEPQQYLSKTDFK